MKSFKYLRLTLILGIAAFIISNLVFSNYSGVHDGLTRIGFPFVYLQDTGGKCYDCESIKWFKVIYLLLDMLLFLIFAMMLVLVLKRKNIRLEMKKMFLVLAILLFVTGCGNSGFEELEDPNVFYQISPGKTSILRVRYTVDKGAPAVQIFDVKGNLLKSSMIAPVSGLLMTASKNDSIQMTYFVGQSDLNMFLPWFRTNKYNVNRLGDYLINYNYEIHNTYLENKGSEIDSLSVDEKGQLTSVFLKGKLIAKKPTYLFVVKSSKMLLYDPSSKSYTPYTFTNNSSFVKDYLKKILALYE